MSIHYQSLQLVVLKREGEAGRLGQVGGRAWPGAKGGSDAGIMICSTCFVFDFYNRMFKRKGNNNKKVDLVQET